ncbi:arginine biosynthesis ArgJ [Cladochytrium replicatum]|nr:arginine biosynthesis ArgJ [Cladochytrium replicatum]
MISHLKVPALAPPSSPCAILVLSRFYSAAATNPRAAVPTSGTYPSGFVTYGLHAGIKKGKDKKDLALVVSPHHPCTVSAVFTQNAFAAAPVQVSKQVLKSSQGGVHAVVVNAGCANACTGVKGVEDAWAMVEEVDSGVVGKPGAKSTLVMSTGVIGQNLPMEVIKEGVRRLKPLLRGDHEGWMQTAEAIMTTDTFPKLRSNSYCLPNGATYRMAGWCKGAGMIHPNMATMLSAIFTDASITKECLDLAMSHAVDVSFNAISVDGDTSTNDTFMVLANGGAVTADTSQPQAIISDPNSAEFAQFQADFTTFAANLAKLIVLDGEGATTFIEVRVINASTFRDAKRVANTIAKSPLVKTAIYGRDANWGRIVCAVGYSEAENIEPEKVNLRVRDAKGTELHLFRNGAPYDVNEGVAKEILESGEVVVEVDLGVGGKSAVVYTCDFSEEYIQINGSYRT